MSDTIPFRSVPFVAVLVIAFAAVGGLAAVGAADEHANVDLADQEAPDGEEIVVEEVSLSKGGYAVVRNQGGGVVGVSEHLGNGTHEDVVIALDDELSNGQVVIVEAYRGDEGGLEDVENASAYRTEDDFAVSDTAFVEVDRETATPTETEAETDADSETATPTAETDDSTPGFGALAALVALVAAALVAVRRD